MMMFPQGSGVMPAAARRPSGVGSPAQPFASRITGFFVCISIGWLVFLVQYFGDDGSSGTGHYHQASSVTGEPTYKATPPEFEAWCHFYINPQLSSVKEAALIGQRLGVSLAAHLDSLVVPLHYNSEEQEDGGFQDGQGRVGSLRGAVSGDDEACPGGIVALTYASHPGRDDRFCRSLESALRHDVPLRVLGWGVPWEGLAQKLQASYASVSSLPPQCVVLFVDGFDVLFADNLQAIKASFLEMQAPLLFSAECGCWPQVQRGIDVCLNDYPQAPTKYRYLNSGSWMGYASHARVLLEAIIKEGGQNFNKLNDQELVSDMYMAGRYNLTLDHHARIFQSMHATDAPLPDCHPERHVKARDGHWYNDHTKTKPAIFHFNGGGKDHHLAMERKVWYKTDEFRAEDDVDATLDKKLWMNGEMLKLREVCPPEFYNIRA